MTANASTNQQVDQMEQQLRPRAVTPTLNPPLSQFNSVNTANQHGGKVVFGRPLPHGFVLLPTSGGVRIAVHHSKLQSYQRYAGTAVHQPLATSTPKKREANRNPHEFKRIKLETDQIPSFSVRSKEHHQPNLKVLYPSFKQQDKQNFANGSNSNIVLSTPPFDNEVVITKAPISEAKNSKMMQIEFDQTKKQPTVANAPSSSNNTAKLRVKSFAAAANAAFNNKITENSTQDSGFFDVQQNAQVRCSCCPTQNSQTSSSSNISPSPEVNKTKAIATLPASSSLHTPFAKIVGAEETNANAAIAINLAETEASSNNTFFAELNEAMDLLENNNLDINADESNATDPSNADLIDELINQEMPDQKDVLFGLHNVRRPRNTDQYSFHKQKREANEILKGVFETLNAAPVETELADDPQGLTVPLMQHQRHALKWMQYREERHPYGGLLADDMGLGKTLSMLALIMAEKNRLAEHNQVDEDDEDVYTGNTLVVCPPSLLRQWEMEVYTKFNYTLIPLVFYGKVSKADIKNIKKFDVVCTTYDTLLNRRLAKHIYNINWRRIILDEAHIIRNPSTQKSEAVCGVHAKHHWALTGTPIHNKETDVYALLRYLKYEPFDERSYWNIWLSEHRRLGVLLRSIMLRRTKEELQRKNLWFNLPPQKIERFEINLSDEEMDVHQAILSFSRPLVKKYIDQFLARQDANYVTTTSDRTTIVHNLQKQGPNQKDYKQFLKKLHAYEANIGQHVIYVLLLRLQQVCCHPGLAEQMLYDDIDEEVVDVQDKRIESKIKEEPNHSFKTSQRTSTVREILNRKNPIFDFRVPSSKMLQVKKILQERVMPQQDKAVIVSQWTGYLEVIEHYLAAEGIPVLNFNGKMSLDERQKSLDDFNYVDSATKVLLLSLKCGGVGLNLTAANHLILMDLPWNPQLETQAQDRIYRLGQMKPVFVYKFLCVNTVELNIKSKQDDKLKLADSVLTGAQQAGRGFSIQELKKLFNIND